ncbi:MAG: hypothetical protein ACOYOA_00920 [Saprospiraceae bacterium]
MKYCYFFLVGGLCSLVSCDNEKLRQATIQQKVNERISEFKSKKMAGCKQQAMEVAVKRADSILLMNTDLWQIQTDDIERPPIPEKPGLPNVKVTIDSSKVKPLFPVNFGQ